eukprot:g31095.t1
MLSPRVSLLKDETFFKRHASPGAGLDSRGLDADSPTAALAAATYDGLSQPSPFIGGGVLGLRDVCAQDIETAKAAAQAEAAGRAQQEF